MLPERRLSRAGLAGLAAGAQASCCRPNQPSLACLVPLRRTALHIKPVFPCCRRTGLLMLSRLASTAVTVRLHKQIFFESEATSMATFLWKVHFMLAWLLGEVAGSCCVNCL